MRNASKEREAFQLALGEKLRKLRLSRGLTATDLSEVLHCGRRAIVYYEGGEQLPSIDALARIARALDTPLSTVVSVLDDLPPPEAHTRARRAEQLENARRRAALA
jgi:transcriptional regulator with XRE-family HTH domain